MPKSTGTMSDEVAAQVLQALRSGQTLFSICGGRPKNGERYPRITYYEPYRAYCAAKPEYAREANALLAKSTAAANARKGMSKSFKLRTHCLRGHALTLDNLYFKSTNGTRQCKACTLASIGRGGPVTKQQIEKVRRAVLTGMNISDITRSNGKRKPILSFAQLKRVRIECDNLNRFIIENVHSWRSRKALIGPMGIARLDGRMAQIIRLPRRADEIEIYEFRPGDFEWLYGLTPWTWPKFAREEIVGDLFLELSERLIHRDDIPGRVKFYVAKHNRDYPSVSHGDLRSPLSLDAPIFEDGNMTRADTIVRGLWD
ncbi:hypothetical protein BRADO0477 [Bradyrhizobium sp. ORS 278]|uniref:hypothetical protein n=1 Tax=Bradyrhizobium sp. (strain ORS 278) TaxID=114615 RepID=UPI0001507845|nr:hypothetical protein [Bradyrhizobium sp. ORS 278]CAL74420.1 hypothetical protein BRADO0477 [Bradyrhizobium sp. ORS 278]